MAIHRIRLAVGLFLPALFFAANAAAQQTGPNREELDGHLARLVTQMRADVSNLEDYEPLLVFHVLHDERGYRVQVSDLLERRLTDALAAQGVRVIDPIARQRILDDLEDCYTDEAPFCRAADVVGRFQTAGGVLEGSVLAVRGGTELRLKLVVAGGVGGLSPGEIVGTWSVTVPPPSLDPVEDLLPAAGVVAYGRPPGDSVPPEQLGQLRVDVRTQDGSQAWVQIDERVVVPAPVTTTTAAGQHLLTVTASGHRPFSGYVEVPPRSMLRREIVLERGVGSIQVVSNAIGADVFLDEGYVGTTPWRADAIETGTHSVRVEIDGFVPFSTDFVLEHDESLRIEAVLTELPGDIVITCLHDDVLVFLDDPANGPVGTCSTGRSLTLTDVEPGVHRVWGGRDSEQTPIQYVTVHGGRTVPVSLSLRLGMPVDARAAAQRSAARDYEPFGGHRLQSGLYFDIGFIGGQANWDMLLDDFRIAAKPNGYGARLAASFLDEIWEFKLGGDYVFLESFEDYDSGDEFDAGRFLELYLGLTGYFLPRSSLRPFLGFRGLYNWLSFDDPLRIGDPRLTANGLGLGAHGGLNVLLGRKAALEFGASYSWTGSRDIRGEISPGGEKWSVGRIEDWHFISGFASLWIHIH
jgi:hypothetical protein